MKHLEPLASHKTVRLPECAPAELPVIQVDGQRIRQTFTNLLSNALTFMPP